MKKIKWIRLLLYTLLGICVVIGVLALFYQQPRFVRLGKTELINVTDSFANIRLSMAVKNPNFFSISGKNIKLEFAESGIPLGEGQVDKMSIPGFAEADVDLILKVNVNQVLRTYRQHNSDTITPSVAINGSFMPFFFLRHINIRKEVPKKDIYALLLKTFQSGNGIRVDSFRVKRFSVLESQVDFNILFTNNYNIDLQVNSIAAQVYPDKRMNVQIGSVELQREIPLRPGTTISIPLHLSVNNFAMMRAMVENGVSRLKTVFIQGEAKFMINNTLVAVPFEVPVGNVE